MQRASVLIITVWFGFSAAAWAQVSTQPPPQQPQPPTSGQPQKTEPSKRLTTRAELVLVPVTVKDDRGNIIGDLRREEFRIFEDGVQQPISIFSADPVPLSAVVLIDNDISQKPAAQVQKSLESISAGFGAADEVALVVYDEYPEAIQDFTFNNDELFTKLKRLQLGSSFPGNDVGPMTSGPLINGQSDAPQVRTGASSRGVTKRLDDAVYEAGQMLRTRGRDRRKIIFLISDGANSHHNKWNFDQTRQLLLQSDVSVYTISVGNAFLKHESSRLLKYANDTGGDSFYAAKQRDLERLYSTLTEEARNQYTLAFAPAKSDSSQDFHPIEVRVERPNLHVLARQGFYAAVLQ